MPDRIGHRLTDRAWAASCAGSDATLNFADLVGRLMVPDHFEACIADLEVAADGAGSNWTLRCRL